MRFFTALIVVSFALSACTNSDIPADSSELCPDGPSDLMGAGFASEAELGGFLNENKVEFVNDVAVPLQINFAWELRKFPVSVRKYLVKTGAKFRILTGQGVGEDPQFGYKMTSDGRNWIRVPGAGGLTTWVVANRTREEGHGVSVILHERAHTLDGWGVPGISEPGYYKLSDSKEWLSIIATDTVYQDVISRSCGQYCTQKPVESFAETFAMYHARERSRALVSRSPRVVKFFDAIIAATEK